MRISGMLTWDSASHLFLSNAIGQPATPTRKLPIIPDSSSDEKALIAMQPAW